MQQRQIANMDFIGIYGHDQGMSYSSGEAQPKNCQCSAKEESSGAIEPVQSCRTRILPHFYIRSPHHSNLTISTILLLALQSSVTLNGLLLIKTNASGRREAGGFCGYWLDSSKVCIPRKRSPHRTYSY